MILKSNASYKLHPIKHTHNKHLASRIEQRENAQQRRRIVFQKAHSAECAAAILPTDKADCQDATHATLHDHSSCKKV
jgi:hypothetical protein